MKENLKNILYFHLFFSFIFPISFYVLTGKIQVTGFYLCMLLLFSTFFMKISPEKLNGLTGKQQQSTEMDYYIYYISPAIIYLLTLIGVLIQSSDINGNYTIYSIPAFIMLASLSFPFSTMGMEHILNASHQYIKKDNSNKQLIIIGLVYIIFVLLLQFTLLKMINTLK